MNRREKRELFLFVAFFTSVLGGTIGVSIATWVFTAFIARHLEYGDRLLRGGESPPVTALVTSCCTGGCGAAVFPGLYFLILAWGVKAPDHYLEHPAVWLWGTFFTGLGVGILVGSLLMWMLYLLTGVA